MNARPTASRLLLVADARGASASKPAVSVRRYRLVRIAAGNQFGAGKGDDRHRN